MAESKEYPDTSRAGEWQAVVSGRAQLALSELSLAGKPVLKMDFDFKGGAGFVVARRAFIQPMPEDYVVSFRVRGKGPANDLELKLVDSSGQNVWRHVQKALKPSARWRRVSILSRDIDFAWGPASGARLAALGSVEFAVVAGEGGSGSFWLTDLSIDDLTPRDPPRVRVSSAQAGTSALDAPSAAGWIPEAHDSKPWIEIDWTALRTLGGLVIDWRQSAPPTGFRLRSSNTGRRFRTVYAASSAGGKRSYLYLPGLESRYLRLELDEPTAGAWLQPQGFEFSRSIHAFWHSIAAVEARGWHPRWVHGEQSLWTPLGIADGTQCALINEDGMVEVAPGSFSVEPMLWIGAELVTWADGPSRQTLQDGWMPAPSVHWDHAQWRLSIEACATAAAATRIRYTLENLSDQPIDARLFILVRPFQVTPPWQSFRGLGGVSKILDVQWSAGALHINGRPALSPQTAPSKVGAIRFDAGCVAAHLAEGTITGAPLHDEFGFATAVLQFDMALGAQQSDSRVLTSPASSDSALDPAYEWGPRIRVDQWQGPGLLGQAIQAALTATAQVLLTRDGPALQPGPRRYTRSWIRDGAMMSAALLRMGHAREVRDFIRWYAPHQRGDGFVPCCVDREGIDWLVEHDSHGELLALIGDYVRFTADHALAGECWSYITRAAEFIERQLGKDGLLPVSVSHEGYLAQPVHSYWDDFWAVRGLREAALLAQGNGHPDESQRWNVLASRLSDALILSIETTRADRGLDFIPGSVEWADFDPTATANAIYLMDVPEGLSRVAVDNTFDKYLLDWRGKRAGTVPWTNYTPYEIRIIGALVRLGRRDAALELLSFFLADRRPVPWNQWPEIAWRDPRTPGHLGDLPHTWIAAEYVLAVRTLFAYERGFERTLILAAGLDAQWLDGAGVRVSAMPTCFGDLSYTLRRIDANTVQFAFGAAVTAPMILRPPLVAPLLEVTVDGRAHGDFDEQSARIAPGASLVTLRSGT